MKQYDNYLRWLYRGGHPNRFARLQNRATAAVFAAGIFLPKRTAELQVRGRRSGRVISFPVVIADYEGERYLVSMLGENVNWVRNLRAADYQAVLRHGHRETVHLETVDGAARAPVLRRYLRVAPGARPHVPVDFRAPAAEFEKVAADYPVFRIDARAA
ncbi:MAG TPA: nitroreductase/quinone reductase family protein [Trebonia sp.]|nr:nitroreductase/quinone reductase family protein [Trebonia sp.]